MPIIIAALSISILSGCETPIRNHQLKSLNTRLSTPGIDADAARNIYLTLKDISVDSLNEAERNFRSFLLIKSADKAYISHSNDTTYLNVKEYFRTEHTELYPEVLYYGGRVYSDIGDTQTALEHFTEALEKLENSKESLNLRATINSQTGRLLNEIRVYDQALGFLKESIRIGGQLKDTVGTVYDLQLAGAISLRAERLDEAKEYLIKAQSLSGDLNPSFNATNSMYLALASYKTGELSKARMHIQRALTHIDSLKRNEAYIIGAEIYFEAAMNDSSYILAKKVVDGKNNLCKPIAYHHLISKLSRYIPTDSLDAYLTNYQISLEKNYNLNENQASIMQLSLYNYKVHDRKRMEAERKQQALFYWIIGIVMIALLIIIVLLGIKYRQQCTINALRTQLDNIRILRERFNATNKDNTDCSGEKDSNIEENAANEISLRERLRKEYMDLYNDKVKKDDAGVDSAIIAAPEYKEVLNRIENKQGMPEADPLWNSLEKMILKVSPRFIDNLSLLMGGKITKTELRTALLLKCGIRLSHMAFLCCRTDSSISSRRDTISKKAFGHKLDPKIIDGIIRLL